MKKTIYGLLLCAVMLTVSACGTDEAGQQESVHSETGQDVAGEEETYPSDIEDGLLGVYEGATEYVEVPMGRYFDGVQKEFCKIKMPLEYLMSGSYTEDGENSVANQNAQGIPVKNYDFSNEEIVNKWIVIMSTGGTTMNFYIVPTTERTMDDEKAYAGEYQEIADSQHEVIYFADSTEYSTTDLSMSYELNEDMLLYVTYEGPLAEKLGLDQLAQNIYDLIEVTE